MGAAGEGAVMRQADAAARPQAASGRVQAIDWLRGLVMVLMTIDHAGAKLDVHHMHGDAAHGWLPGSGLPPGEFLTRWITHVCAPAFVLLAGTALALSTEKRSARPGQTGFIVRRGLLIAALDPLWLSLCFFGAYKMAVFQVLYAIGMGLVCMAFLRRLPTWALLGGAIAIQLGGEFVGGLFPEPYPGNGVTFDRGVWQTPVRYFVGTVLFNGGPMLPHTPAMCAYPLIPWLSMMMAGWVLGRWLLATPERSNPSRALPMVGLGVALLGVFAIVRGIDGYGNWGLHRDSLAPLEWLHVAKYPPSLSYTTLELGLTCLLLAAFLRVDDGRARPWLRPLSVLGSTAFFYYLLHVALIQFVGLKLLHIDPTTHGLTKTWVGAALTVLALYPLCVQYRRYKAAHPDGWTRYI
jgi:uncharacterized membrane protein